MSNIGSYTTRSFSETQKFLVLDPSTSTTSLVLGSDLVAHITPSLNSVKAETTRLSAENTDYEIGTVVQTTGETSVDDGQAGVFLVVEGGTGDFPMLNGNDLLVIGGDAFLREQLASDAPGDGASLVVRENGNTLEADAQAQDTAINNRVIRVSSRTEMKAYDVPAGTQFSLEEGGRSGLFVVKSGTPPSDPQEGVYVVLNNGNYTERLFSGAVDVAWFGAVGDWDNSTQTGTDDQPAFQAAVNYAESEGADVYIGFPKDGKEFYLGSHVLVGSSGNKVTIFHRGLDGRIIRKSGTDYGFIINGADFCEIKGFAISGQGPSNAADNTGTDENYPALKSRNRCNLELTALFCGGPNYPNYSEFNDIGSGSKCYAFGVVTENTGGNYSDIKVGAKQCFGDAYFCGTEAGVRQTQAQKIEIWTSFQCTGYAFNIHKGFRNRVLVRHCEGGNHTALGRFGDVENYASTIYCEGNVGTGYVFDAGQNYAEMQNETMTTPYVLNNSNNEYRAFGPLRKHYTGFNGIEVSGPAINFVQGIEVNGLQLLEEDNYTATFTPETSGTITLDGSFNVLSYTRIGRLVNVIGQVNVSSVSSPVGTYVEVNLPYPIDSSSGLSERCYGYVYDIANEVFLSFRAVTEGASTARIIIDASTITGSDSYGLSLQYHAEV